MVTQYFRPEVGATQNRLGSFVDGLVQRGHEVTVVCEQPNHPEGVFHTGFGRRPVRTERLPRLTVHRLWVAASPRKSTARRLAFYGTFAAGALAATVGARRHDVVFASSPPLPGALTAGLAAALRRTPFVLDVRDLWPAAAEALGELSNPRLLRALQRSERWLYRHARAVTATTRPFCQHIDSVAGHAISVLVPNGALDDLVTRPPAPRPAGAAFTLGYVGNLGIAQGLGIVLDAARLLRDEDMRIVLVGAGPVAEEIRRARDEGGLTAIDMRPPVPTSEVGDLLESFDALLVPLRARSALADFIPSKLYDAMAVGRPAIVACDGEAAALVRATAAGVVIAPEDGAALADALRRLRTDPAVAREMGEAGKLAAQGLARSRQVATLERVLLDAAGRTDSRAA